MPQIPSSAARANPRGRRWPIWPWVSTMAHPLSPLPAPTSYIAQERLARCDLGNRDQDRSALVLDEENDESCRRGCAGITTNDVHVVGPFIEGLAGIEGN